ncbi:T3SS effector HopA1 family protein [Streptomyces sp. NPDC001948]
MSRGDTAELLDPRARRGLRGLRAEIDRLLVRPSRVHTTDEADLTDLVYRTLHSRNFPPGGRDSANRAQFTAMLTAARARLADVTVPHPDWTRARYVAGRLIVRHRDGSEAVLPPSVAATWPKDVPALDAPALAVASDTRWLRWNPPGLPADALRARLYLNVRPDRAVDVWCRLVRSLTGSPVAFATKICGSPELLARADSIVVYLPPAHLPDALAAVDAAGVAHELAPEVPAFSSPVAPGIGAATVPEGQPAHTSVGLHWSRELASGWLDRGSVGIDEVSREVAESWSDILHRL